MPKLSINLTEENYKKLMIRKGRSGASISWQINDLLENIFKHIETADRVWAASLQANCAQKLDTESLQASTVASSDGDNSGGVCDS